MNNVTNSANSVVSTATGTLNSQLQNLTGFQIDGALTSLGPSRTLVFSPTIVEALSANGLPAPTAQQIGSFQGLTAATREIGGRLAALRTGRYLTSSRNARANEFSGSKNPKSEITMLDDGRWFEILVQGDAMDLDLDNFGAADTLDLRTYAASVAVDYHPNRYQALGVAGSWTETDAQLGNGLGDPQVNGAVISAYGSWYDGPFYVDGLIACGKMRHDISRTALNKRTAFSDTESNSLSLQANTGANLEVGKSVTGLYLSAEYTRSEIDSYSESGAGLFNIAVNDHESDSLSSDLG